MRRILPLLFALASCLFGQIKDFDEYKAARAALISEAQEHSCGHTIVLSKDEEKVNAYLMSLLAKECSKPRFLPALNFVECQKEIESSSLYRFLQRMPKGGILHAHTPAIGDLHWLVTEATYRPDCYIYVGENKEKLLKGCVRIFATPPSRDWEPISVARQKSGDSVRFDQKLYESFVIQAKDLAQPHVWDKFQNSFRCFFGVFSDIKLYKTYIKKAILQLIQEDNVQYIELRDSPDEDLIVMYQEICQEVQKSFPYFSLKIICYANRNKERAQVLELAKEALRLRKKYPEIVAGFDLTGEEDLGHPTFYFVEDFLALEKKAQQDKVVLPYYFHSGETNWPFGTYCSSSLLPFNDNLYDVLLLKSKRVGHGLSLIKNPFLMEKFKQADIAIETCPISNQVLGYVHDLRSHPALTYLNAGLTVTISSDDPAIFGYKGVTPDFWEACVAWQLDLRALKQLALNSITHSSLDEKQKSSLLKVWQQKWDEFIAATLQTMSAERGELRKA